jgi:hypothetical protein
MARLPASQENAGINAIFPSATTSATATATNGTTTLTFASTLLPGIIPGMAVTGAGITSGGLVTGVNYSTGVVTISGTITTLTTSTYVFTLNCWLALFTTDPTTVGTSGEVTGGSYARQALSLGAPSAGSAASTNAQNFTSMPVEAGGVPYFAIFAAVSGTTYYLCGGTTTGLSGAISAGSTVNFAIGAVTVALS